jgi:hypothetical protein
MAKHKKKTGPKPEALKLEGKWQEAVKKSITKEKPEGGWPQEDKPKK